MSSYRKPQKNRFCMIAYKKAINSKLNQHGNRYQPFSKQIGPRCFCRYGNSCFGAHSEQEFIVAPFILDFFSAVRKGKVNLGKIDKEINRILKEASSSKMILNASNADISSMMIRRKTLNFVEKIQLYIKLVFWISGLKKNKVSSSKSSSRNYYNNLPSLKITDPSVNEDHIWALERMTHYCTDHKKMINNISKKIKILDEDICLGGKNCKYGVHNVYELLNVQDLLTGVSDDPISKEDYDLQVAEFNAKIKNTKENPNLSDEKKNKTIYYFTTQIKKFPRTIHLTELGLVPFSDYQKKMEDEKKVSEAELKKETDTVSIKKKPRKIISKKKKTTN